MAAVVIWIGLGWLAIHTLFTSAAPSARNGQALDDYQQGYADGAGIVIGGQNQYLTTPAKPNNSDYMAGFTKGADDRTKNSNGGFWGSVTGSEPYPTAGPSGG